VKNWPKRIKGRGLKSVVELDDAATNTLVQGKPGSFPTAVLAWNIWLEHGQNTTYLAQLTGYRGD